MGIFEVYPQAGEWILGCLAGCVIYFAKIALNNNTKALENNTLALRDLATRVQTVETTVAVHEVRLTTLEGE